MARNGSLELEGPILGLSRPGKAVWCLRKKIAAINSKFLENKPDITVQHTFSTSSENSLNIIECDVRKTVNYILKHSAKI